MAVRAFPPRWRREHGPELLDLSADLAADGRRRARAAEVVDLVRGGWSVRWHGRPPWRQWLRYRYGQRPVEPFWHAWMRDDLEGKLFVLRFWLFANGPVSLIPLLVFASALSRVGGRPGWSAVGGLALWLGVILLHVVVAPRGARRWRRRMWTAAGYRADGGPGAQPPAPTGHGVTAPLGLFGARIRRPLFPWALSVGLLALLAAGGAVVGALWRPQWPRLALFPPASVDGPGPTTSAWAIALAGVATLGAATVLWVVGSRRAGRAPRITAHRTRRAERWLAWGPAGVGAVWATVVSSSGLASPRRSRPRRSLWACCWWAGSA